ncbi:thioredoxin [candidate division KSB3 bacterium]|uniref:Thioredoxin n=1 Tax=candidate division KSB3 bacterium TaxID=2044937 RepID=A0A2G6E6V6_9BACT|nr:MAG: thioredoxin [candidate division KSB3 bacterium]PIE30199.1 MAG: thioredoxin [candidate division KSB3 bacterium]
MSYEIHDFRKDVIERSYNTPVLVDFWAEWCAPCRILGPTLEALAAQAGGEWGLAKVNTEVHRELAAEYGIQSIPNVKLFVDGEVRDEFVGVMPEETIRKWLKNALPSKFRQQIAEARSLLSQDRLEDAKAVLQDVLEQDNGNEDARVLLATALLFSDYSDAAERVKDISPASDFAQAADAITTIAELFELRRHIETLPESDVKEDFVEGLNLLYRREFDGALTKFITVLSVRRSYHDNAAKKACVAIFNFLGQDHEISQKHRRDFSSTLYA